MKMQNSGHFHGDANSRHQQLAPSVGRRLFLLQIAQLAKLLSQPSKTVNKHHYGVECLPIYWSPTKSSSSELSRSSTRRRKEDLPFHAPSEWRPSYPRATGAVRVSKTPFQSPDQVTGSTIVQNVARSTKPSRNLLNRSCHALPRAGGVTTFLFMCLHVLATCLYVLTPVKGTPTCCKHMPCATYHAPMMPHQHPYQPKWRHHSCDVNSEHGL